MLTYGISPEFRGGVRLFSVTAIRHRVKVPSLSGHAIAYRWRSLPRVRQYRASKPQGGSKRVVPWQGTMDQLICASLSSIIDPSLGGSMRVACMIDSDEYDRAGLRGYVQFNK